MSAKKERFMSTTQHLRQRPQHNALWMVRHQTSGTKHKKQSQTVKLTGVHRDWSLLCGTALLIGPGSERARGKSVVSRVGAAPAGRRNADALPGGPQGGSLCDSERKQKKKMKNIECQNKMSPSLQSKCVFFSSHLYMSLDAVPPLADRRLLNISHEILSQ